MKVNIHKDWSKLLFHEFEKPYFETLVTFVKSEYQKHTIYPPGKQIFSAFNQCPPNNIKVVVLGQDPYHNVGQAHGLAFSVMDGTENPPSLKNIYQEVHRDLNIPVPVSGNLTRWAQQGVLLLNATLTVKAHLAGSHQNKGWEQFTDAVIREVSMNFEHIVFLLWGSYAQKKGSIIDTKKHLVLKAPHPSPLSAHRGFFGCKHFSKTNEYLKKQGKQTIDW